MAGKGKKIFVAGEVLLAQDVNDYLMDQSVMNFASSAARSSAIPTPTEGMVSYLADRNVIEVFNGSAYVAASGLTFINSTTFTAQSSISLPNDTFTNNFHNYRILFELTAVSGSTGINARFRASGSDNITSNYNFNTRSLNSGGVGVVDQFNRGQDFAQLTQGSTIVGNFSLDVFNPKNAVYTSAYGYGTYTLANLAFFGIAFNATTSFDSMTFIASAGNFTGKVSVYGYGI
jgi:hypothetical protein